MAAMRAPANIATPVAANGLCHARSATTPKNAPVSIIPSMAMLTTPLRSEITPPRAGSSSSTAAASVACHRFAVKSRWRMSVTGVMASGLRGRRRRLGHQRCSRRHLRRQGGWRPGQAWDALANGPDEIRRDAEEDQRLQDENQVARDVGVRLHDRTAGVKCPEEDRG